MLLLAAGVLWFVGDIEGVGGWLLFPHRGPLVHLVLALRAGRVRSRAVTALIGVGYLVAAVPWLARDEVVSIGLAIAVVLMASERRAAVLLALALTGPLVVRMAYGPPGAGAALLLYDAALTWLACLVAARSLRPAPITDLVVQLADAPSQSLRDELARTLGDPSLVVGYAAGEGTFVDARGAPVDTAPAHGRVVTPLVRDGQTVGLLAHDPAVLDDPRLLDAVAAAAVLTSANARLQAEVERQADAVRASRRRLVTAAVEERRRLQERLGHGPDHRLAAVAELLGRVRTSDPGAEIASLVDVAGAQVQRAREDLGDLGRGLHPVALRRTGFTDALHELAAGVDLPVNVRAEDIGVVPEDVAATAYYVVSEALTNIVRHADARSATVGVRRDGPVLHVVVSDDGRGGADPTGSGLRGLADRVQALGGELTVSSGQGSRLAATIPLSPA